MKILLTTSITILYIAFMAIITKQYYTETQYIAAKTSQDKQTAETLIDNAIKQNPQQPQYFLHRAHINSQGPALAEILEDLQTVQKLNSNDTAALKGSLKYYYFLAAMDTTTDKKYVQLAKLFSSELKKKNDNDVGTYVLIAKYEKRLGFVEEYEKSIERIRELRPDLLEWHPDLIK